MLDQLFQRAPRSKCRSRRPWRGWHRKDGAVAGRCRRASAFVSCRSRVSRPRWSCHSPACISSARQCLLASTLSAPPADCVEHRIGPVIRWLGIGYSWPSPCSACCCRGGGAATALPGRRRAMAGRSSDQILASWRAGFWRSRWRSCSPFESRRTGPSSRTCPTAARRSGGRGSACAPGQRRAGSARRSCQRPDHRRGPRKSTRSARADRGVSAAELAGGFQLLPAEDLAGHIEDHYLRRVGELPRASQRLMLLAAADPVGDATLLWRAAEGAGDRGERAGASPGCAASGDRSAGTFSSSTGAIGRLSGGATGRPAGRARRAGEGDRSGRRRRSPRLASRAGGIRTRRRRGRSSWNLSAGRAQARGGLAAAAAFLQQAVTLTRDPKRRTERALVAADHGLQAGAFDAARGMMAAAEIGPLDELQRARLDLLRAEASYSESRGSAAPALLLRAAKALDQLDPELARETYLDAWSSALFAGGLAGPAGLREVSHEARSARMPGRPTASIGPTAGRVLAGVHRRPGRRGAGARARCDRLHGRRRLDRGSPSLGVARDRGWCDGVGLRDLPGGGQARSRAGPRGRRAHRAGGQHERDGAGHHAGRDSSARPHRWSLRPMRSPKPRAPRSRPMEPSCSPGLAGPTRASRPA